MPITCGAAPGDGGDDDIHGDNNNDGDGDNLLVRASRRGRVKTVEYLIDLSRERMKFDSISYVNKCNGFGDSPLMAAAINGHVNVVRKLLDLGADAYACHPEFPEGFTVLA